MTEETVVQFPTRLERLADEIEHCLQCDEDNRQEWVKIQLHLCEALVEARSLLAADIEFGRWCDANFSEKSLNHQTRAAAIAMGREPEALRKCLEVTDRRSLEHIYRNEFARFTQVRNPPRRKQEKLDLSRPSPEFEKAKDAYDELKASGEPVTVDKVAKLANVSSTPARIAVAYKHGTEEPAPVTPDEMRPAMRRRYELAIKKARAEIREELRQEVYRECDVFVRHIKEQSDRADRIFASHNGVMSKDDFRKIKACLHPDHNTFRFAAEALQIFSELEDVLVKPDEPAREGVPPLPSTAAELMARRRR